MPGAVGTTMYPYNQMNQAVPGSHNYTALPGYAMPGHQIVQFGGPNVNAMTTTSVPTIPSPFPAGNMLYSSSSAFQICPSFIFNLLYVFSVVTISVIFLLRAYFFLFLCERDYFLVWIFS